MATRVYCDAMGQLWEWQFVLSQKGLGASGVIAWIFSETPSVEDLTRVLKTHVVATLQEMVAKEGGRDKRKEEESFTEAAMTAMRDDKPLVRAAVLNARLGERKTPSLWLETSRGIIDDEGTNSEGQFAFFESTERGLGRRRR